MLCRYGNQADIRQVQKLPLSEAFRAAEYISDFLREENPKPT